MKRNKARRLSQVAGRVGSVGKVRFVVADNRAEDTRLREQVAASLVQ